jgi:hypothetical protein
MIKNYRYYEEKPLKLLINKSKYGKNNFWKNKNIKFK